MNKELNFALDELTDIEVSDIYGWDAPDFCDAYISYAEYNGVALTDEELDIVNDNSDFVYDAVINWIY